MGAAPGGTQDRQKLFCTWSLMAAMGLGIPSDATVTGAGLAQPARNPALVLHLKMQHKAGHPCPCPIWPLLQLVQSWWHSVPILRGHPPEHTPLGRGGGDVHKIRRPSELF